MMELRKTDTHPRKEHAMSTKETVFERYSRMAAQEAAEAKRRDHMCETWPDLLEALEHVLSICTDPVIGSEYETIGRMVSMSENQRLIRAAIARARGEG